MVRSYRALREHWWHALTDGDLALVVGHLVLGVWTQRPGPVIALAAVVAFAHRPRSIVVACLVVGVIGAALSSRAWREAAPDRLGPFTGWVCLVTDPAQVHGAVAVVIEVAGERFEVYARGSPSRRIDDHLAGECAVMTGRRQALAGADARRAAVRHVVGQAVIDTVSDWSQGSALSRASNRVRRLFATGASQLRPPSDSLFAGLVLGDDRRQPPAMVQQFRRAGLSHLTAVSGSNVAFVLAAASPFLRRLSPLLRWLATVGLIAWFAALTRFEPSILRASVMAALASTAYVLGFERPAARALVVAVGLLVAADPMLVWSVGFWLSASATAGVALLGGPLARVMPGPGWLTLPLGVTLGAQLAVAPVALLVFGTLPLVSIPANLLAVPVAGAVMLYGLPAALVAGAVGGSVATVVQLPSELGTRWVATVAALAARLEPSPAVAAVGWTLVIAVVVGRARCAARPTVCHRDR